MNSDNSTIQTLYDTFKATQSLDTVQADRIILNWRESRHKPCYPYIYWNIHSTISSYKIQDKIHAAQQVFSRLKMYLKSSELKARQF